MSTIINQFVLDGYIKQDQREQFMKLAKTSAISQMKKKMMHQTETSINIYVDHILDVAYMLLQESSNVSHILKKKLDEGQITIADLLKQEEDILPEALQTEKDIIQDLQSIKIEYKEHKLYSCKKCKSKKVATETHQNRSADEPATLYIECQDCGYKYTIG